jgi:nucleoside-diphosphate-sugar epimerase
MPNGDRVVVLGGAGFIGRELVAQLRGRVESITVAGRRPAAAVPAGADYVIADVTDGGRIMDVLRDATVVYQLTIESDYGLGARNVAEACLQHGVRRLIFASTSDALYLGRKGRIDESDGPDPKPQLRNPYSRGKIESERLLGDYYASKNLPVVIMRPCLVVGSGGSLQHGGIGSWKTPTCLVGWGDGNNPLPFVLVRDVADAMVRAMDAPGIEGKTFNLVGDVFLSAREYIRLAGERTLRNFRYYPRNLPLFNAKVTAKTLVKRMLGRGGARQYYRDMLSSAMYSQINNRAAKELLGWNPNASLEVFVREAIDCHAEPVLPGDLRLAGAVLAGRS